MDVPFSFSQASLAGTILASTVGTYMALSPPHQNKSSEPSAGDLLSALKLTNKHVTKVAVLPLGLMALHTSSLAYYYPQIPPRILRHGLQNGLNTNLTTWSSSTAIPLALILCVGVPLRLVSYAFLGKNFTFALAEPDQLTTTGIYRFVQHPSYTGLFTVIVCNLALLGRLDGTLSCWIPPSLYDTVRWTQLCLAPVGLTLLLSAMRTRVVQEESMLRGKFGAQWEQWHARTARFVPWLF